MRALILLLLICLNGCLVVRIAPWRSSGEVKRKDLPTLKSHQGDVVRNLLGPDAIPAIDNPTFVSGSEAQFMKPEELVLGVVVNGLAKAYSLWHLDRHEIVNDWIGDTPVAVTW